MTKVLICTPFEQGAGFVSGGINVWGNAIVSHARKQDSGRTGIELVPVSFDRRFYVNASTTLFRRIASGVRDYLRPVHTALSHLRKDSFDVLHLCSSAHLGLIRDLCVINMARRHHVRTVVHFHFGRIPDILAEGGWERTLLRKVCRSVDSIVVMDMRSYNALHSDGFMNVSYVPNPLSEKVVASVDEEMQGGVERIPGKVLFAGHVVETKGVLELVRACSRLKGVQLHMVGKVSDAMKRSLEAAAHSREDGEWLHVRGEMSHEKVIKEMLSSQLFVLPSYTEGFPNVILESMACGCAIVATPVGAVPEMLQFNDSLPCGVCVPVKDENQLAGAMASLLEDSFRSAELGRRASSRVRAEYSIGTVWNHLVNVWHRAL